MSLFLATLLSGLLLAGGGAALLWRRTTTEAILKAFPRSTRAAYFTMGIGSAWFLYRILTLSEADFGNLSLQLFILFAAIAILSFVHVKDFLAVRGLSVLVLLIASVLLSAAFLQPQGSRLFLVSFVYLAIVVAIYLGASPYRLRDFFDWLFAVQRRVSLFGGALFGYGLLLTLISVTYLF